MALRITPAEAAMMFQTLCKRYSHYLEMGVRVLHAGWLTCLQWALEEAEALGYNFRIKSFSVHANRLVPHFSEGDEADQKAIRGMLSETEYFCPCCGQSLEGGRML